MSTVLIGWELGAGSGHVQRMVPLVDRFLHDGWKVVVASRDVRLAARLLASAAQAHVAELEIRQAPIFLHRSPGAIQACALSEMLAHIGFANIELVRPVVGAWDSILRQVEPDVIISDTAPSLNVAAFGRVRVIGLGSGWALPPGSLGSALYREPPDEGRGAARAAEKVLETVNLVKSGGLCIERFSDLLRGQQNFVCTLRQLDPYRGTRTERLYWPIEIAAPPQQVVRPARGSGLIYLPKKHPAIATVVAAAARGSTQFRAYFGGEMHSGRNLTTSAEPLALEDELRTCALAVHHGGLGTAIWCLTRRVPQMICCLDFEKLLIAKGVREAGAGYAFQPGAEATMLAQAFDHLLRVQPSRPDYRHLVTLSPEATIDSIVRAAKS